MKIKFNTTVSGPGVRFVRGVVYDLPKTRAKEFLDARYATPVAVTPDSREVATPNIETR